MRVRLSKRAARDLIEIAAAVGRANPAAARAIRAAIAATQTVISEHPGIGGFQQGRDLRKVVVPRRTPLARALRPSSTPRIHPAPHGVSPASGAGAPHARTIP